MDRRHRSTQIPERCPAPRPGEPLTDTMASAGNAFVNEQLSEQLGGLRDGERPGTCPSAPEPAP
ncbi:MAG TPA: hypothetical protein ENK18_00985 [Deltaproteobacteria bacterium]|nr:hypothetical protein [Deltaproteobacteria bacterium]